jgi:hypothetical protein
MSRLYFLTLFWILLFTIRRHYALPTLPGLLPTEVFSIIAAVISGWRAGRSQNHNLRTTPEI